MVRGDVSPVTAGDADDIYCVDAGVYDRPEYGAVYVIASDRPAIVDTGIGTGYETLLDVLASLGIAPGDLDVIAPTHVHLDHAGGAGYLARECPNADVYVHERGARHLVEPDRLWEGTKRAAGDRIDHYAEPVPIPEDRIVQLADGDEIDVGDRSLAVHDAPGHAPHQAVFYDPASDGVFAADAAGIYRPSMDEPGPTSPPPDFDLEQCLADVDFLQSLDPSAIYYGHFGDAPADGLLAAYAETLQEWVADIAAARDDLEDDDAVIEHFATQVDVRDGVDPATVRGEAEMNVRGGLRYLDERAA
jgi:glyoxylase-like metal-dependent hydrolase (beta-lactamase superfamily II)